MRCGVSAGERFIDAAEFVFVAVLALFVAGGAPHPVNIAAANSAIESFVYCIRPPVKFAVYINNAPSAA
jgi:hypothetical protein